MVFILEHIGYIAAFFTTLSFLPQTIMTIKTNDTESISLTMYSLFILGVILWLFYGVINEEYSMVIANAIILVFAGMILWRKIKNELGKRVS